MDMTQATAVKAESITIPTDKWAPAMGLVCRLTVDLRFPHFRVNEILHLQKGSVVDTGWSVTSDVPFSVNGRTVARGEFEVVGECLAFRLTELT